MDCPLDGSLFADATAGHLNRRHWMRRCGMGFGGLALGSLLARQSPAVASAAAPAGESHGAVPLHFSGTAKHVIHVFLNGGMSQVDTFDPKPELTRRAGQRLPFDNLQTERPTGVALPSPFTFERHGESGIPVSDLFPRLARCVDEMTVIRSMQAETSSHEHAMLHMNTGDMRLVRPSIGSWLTWGMGTANENLPAFVALCPGDHPVAGAANWRSAFLPGAHQGTLVDTSRADGSRLIDHLRNQQMSDAEQAAQFELLQQFNHRHLERRPGEEAIEARLKSFDLAFRMQSEASEAFDVSQEPRHIVDLYGPGPQNRQLLIARRLVERGVRFVQTWHGGSQPWDSHEDIATGHRKVATECDSGLAALIIDLKQRGMLGQTLVVCTGEFGRTPTVELGLDGSGAKGGRDHNHWGFTLWMAGGGVRGGMVYGATDEFGYRVVENPVSIHDLHATILHLMGYDHQRLTFRYAGRDFRLTDVHGSVVRPILAAG